MKIKVEKGRLRMIVNEMVESGIKSPKDIAQKIGVSVNSVKQEVYHLRKENIVNVDWVPKHKRVLTIYLSEGDYDNLYKHALAYNSTVVAIASKLIKFIIRDKLIDAVLDE